MARRAGWGRVRGNLRYNRACKASPSPTLLRGLKGGVKGQLALFEAAEPAADDWPLGEKVAAQEEMLGTGVIAHPLELVANNRR